MEKHQLIKRLILLTVCCVSRLLEARCLVCRGHRTYSLLLLPNALRRLRFPGPHLPKDLRLLHISNGFNG
jgi:hypothetical protein